MGRIGWILAGGAAIIGGMIVQDGIGFDFGDDGDRHVERKVDRRVNSEVDSAVDRIVAEETGRVTVVVDGRSDQQVEEAQAKAIAVAVKDLVKAEAAYVLSDVKDESRDAQRAARDKRDAARERLDTLAKAIEDEQRRDQIDDQKREIRNRVRTEVRDLVRG